MNVKEEKKIRHIIKQELKNKYYISETDLIVPNEKNWDKIKGEFKSLIKTLLLNLEKDEYKDATGDIEKAILMLKSWKKKIEKEITDSSQTK